MRRLGLGLLATGAIIIATSGHAAGSLIGDTVHIKLYSTEAVSNDTNNVVTDPGQEVNRPTVLGGLRFYVDLTATTLEFGFTYTGSGTVAGGPFNLDITDMNFGSGLQLNGLTLLEPGNDVRSITTTPNSLSINFVFRIPAGTQVDSAKYQFQIAPVPEPGSGALAMAGAAAALMRRRRHPLPLGRGQG